MNSGLYTQSSTNLPETPLPAVTSGWLIREIPVYFTQCSAQMKPDLDLGNNSEIFYIFLMTKGQADDLFFLSSLNFCSWLQSPWPRPEFQKHKGLLLISKCGAAWISALLRNGSSGNNNWICKDVATGHWRFRNKSHFLDPWVKSD